MKANELRIGNYVKFFKGVNECGADWKEYEISNGFDLYKLDENDCADIKPVPLTEEWLVRFGFKKWGRDDLPRTLSYELGWIRIFPSNSFCDFHGYGFIHYKVTDIVESARVKIQYVHQLQNLYFSLTGEELTEK